VPSKAQPLIELINIDLSWTPPFLTPAPDSKSGAFESTIEEELECLRATCHEQIILDLEALECDTRRPRLPQLVLDLRESGTRPLRRVVDAMHALFKACLDGDWPDIRRQLYADLTYRTQMMMTGGPAEVLNTLHPSLTWCDQALLFAPACAAFPGDTEGRGFMLMPCAFGHDCVHPVPKRDGQPMLIYSARLAPGHAQPVNQDPLAALLGTGRTRTLRALTSSGSTNDLANRLSVSPPTASAHATVLREANLITTRRDGQRVRHELTLLGASLLAANPAP
jgi:hypothetical protein